MEIHEAGKSPKLAIEFNEPMTPSPSSKMLRTTLFSNSIRVHDRLYETVRDSLEPIGIKAKRLAESLWEEYEPYADHDFLTKIAEDFQARYWEMFLTTSLLTYIPLIAARSFPNYLFTKNYL